MATRDTRRGLRSEAWWNNAANPELTALYLERFLNYGLTREELQGGRPIIGIAQTGSDLVPCNRHHLVLAERVKAGIRDAGGIPFEFPVHPLQETGIRPTAALDRNLAYLGIVQVLYGYPLDGVVLTTGCDKTTPACLTAAATVNLPAIVLSGGPMLNGYYEGKRAGSGLILWQCWRLLAGGKIDYDEFMERVAASAPSVGHCNTMGTALSMNALAEALGMTLPGCAAIPAPYRERAQMAYETGRRAVALVHEDLTPRKVMTRRAFENAIAVAAAIAASSNCPIHINAIARHVGVELSIRDWQTIAGDIPVLTNVAPAGEFLGEDFYRAGGVPAVMHELLVARQLHGDVLTVSGHTVAENTEKARTHDRAVIRTYDAPLVEHGGFLVMSGNLFDSAVMKTSVIGEAFRKQYLSNHEDPDAFVARAIVFEGPEDYHARIDDPGLEIDEGCILVIRYTGPLGYPGSAEVVNMQPPTALIARGIKALPTLGDGRQSGTADAPSILNASPEAAAGGNLAILKTGDRIRVDLGHARVDVLLTDEEIAARRRALPPLTLKNQTPWQEMYRDSVGQLDSGGCLELALKYQDIAHTMGIPRDSH
ncbi:dihydroxy-acid dehydratase [Corallococcus sp. H22C18031201]|uniref:IlvD/Edd family dehydratase n=1 Tax=Citreicoccus inhibens TaxID=2849499 RepID=UPI000E75929D|nr:IlvD/Edd family dehydratase [Citreicoccus inhibens]MBU8900586.1 dihydroxy-acid dehydratase family protein [Citreicoccus inhibens]RJS23312.1 dihydroxy-acid dehydratase [Corallococcus sp. H22C18031201]